MHKLLDNYLCKKYPKIFSDRNKPMTETCMCWGFAHEDGWFYLIDSLCYQIQYRIENPPWVEDKSFKSYCKRFCNVLTIFIRDCFTSTNLKSWKWKVYNIIAKWVFHIPYIEAPGSIPQVKALQVKEKFGTLRFYYSGGDELINGLVSMAEVLSGYICEDCGKMDHNVGYTEGWIRTCCKEHCRENVIWKNKNDKELARIWKRIEKEKNETKKD